MGQRFSVFKELFVTMEESNGKTLTNSCSDVNHEPKLTPSTSKLNSDCSNQNFETIYNSSACLASSLNKSDEMNGNVVEVKVPISHKCENCSDSVKKQHKVFVSKKKSDDSVKRNSCKSLASSSNGKRGKSKNYRHKDASGSVIKKRNNWVLKFNCAKLKTNVSGSSSSSIESGVPDPNNSLDTCICTGYKRTDENSIIYENNSTNCYQSVKKKQDLNQDESSTSSQLSVFSPVIDLSKFRPDDFPIEDCEELARLERAREMAEGVEPPPGFQPGSHIQMLYPELTLDNLTMLFQTHFGLQSAALSALSQIDIGVQVPQTLHRIVHTQVDYIHCLVPDLLQITCCSFYWGKMDRYEAERLLEGRSEGTFLLRDSAQEEYLFSVTFRKYGRSLHARIEQWNHRFSFDSHDPGVYSSPTVCGLIEHYKDPTCCMFFEPMLTIPLHRNFPFPLQHLCRSVVCSRVNYDTINQLHLPKAMKRYLKEYHYKQRIRVRRFDPES